MGLTKQYVRILPSGRCGLVGSVQSNIVHIDGRVCAVAVCEDVVFWDVRKEEEVCHLRGDKHGVSVLAYEPGSTWTCVGYEDGVIRLFKPAQAESGALVVLSGHKSAVSVLRVDPERLMLASGGKDSQIILWDIVNEAGIVKLSGHKAPITGLEFISSRGLIVSSSKDSLIKFWDSTAHHCVYTLLGHRTEVWDFVLMAGGTRLVTGSVESELKVFSIEYLDRGEPGEKAKTGLNVGKMQLLDDADDQDDQEASTSDQESTVLKCHYDGSLLRNGRGRVQQLKLSPDGWMMLCLSTGHGIDAWKVLEGPELAKALQKKLRKFRKKMEKDGGVRVMAAAADDSDIATLPAEERIRIEFMTLGEQRFPAKVKCVDFSPNNIAGPRDYQIVILLNNNQIQQYHLSGDPGSGSFCWDAQLVATIGTTLGHRSDVRAVGFSSENSSFLTGSAESVKIWNRLSLTCIRTIPCVDVLCATFVPGDRHCVVGCKNGLLSLLDITASKVIETQNAHDGPVWALDSFHDDTGIASGSGDKTVKFWNYELISEDDAKRLSLEHTRTLQMKEDVLCLKFSKNGKFIAVGLLDNTIKLFFVDTLKFFLSMYGHSLPVLCLDISDDSRVLVSGSADKSVKIWGMDFGDCHRSLFAHDDSVTCVRFVPKTHLFLSSGKDGQIRQWDADNFEKVQTLEGHKGEVWCVGVSPNGGYFVSSGHDKSIRLWEKSEEPLVLEEEQEMDREAQYDKTLEQEEDVIPGETEGEISLACKKTIDSVKSTEAIISAVDICREEKCLGEEDQKIKKPPLKHPLIVAYKSSSLECFVLDTLRRIRSSHLEKSLMLVPFSYGLELLGYLADALDGGYEVELACRCLFFLVRIHHSQIVNCSAALPIMDRVRGVTRTKVAGLRDTIGFNLAALKFMQLDLKEKQDIQLFLDASHKRRNKNKAKKRADETASAFVLAL